MDEYENLCERVNEIIIRKGYRLDVEDNGDVDYFNIYDDETIITKLQMTKTTDTIRTGKTRSQYRNLLEDQDVLHVNSVSTEDDYRGQKLALLIIIYGICYMKQKNPDISYVTLDDDSDRNTHIGKNIYDSLGFDYRYPTEMDMTKKRKLIIHEAEKQLLLDDLFIHKSNNHLDKI